MTEQMHFSDEELTSYLDGEAANPLRSRIEKALSDDPQLASRLEQLSIPVELLKSAVETALPPMPDTVLPPAPETRRWAPMSAALAACFVVGLGMGFLASNRATTEPDWMNYVAAYQALYVNGTLAGVDQPHSVQSAQLSKLSAVLGRDLSGATGTPDLDFKRAQLLGFEGMPLVQMAFLSPVGAPMALCVIKSDASAHPVRIGEMEGMQSANWSDGEFAYLLIGGSDANLVANAAEHFRNNL